MQTRAGRLNDSGNSYLAKAISNPGSSPRNPEGKEGALPLPGAVPKLPQIDGERANTKTDTKGVLERGGRVGGGRLDFLANIGINVLSVGVYTLISTLASKFSQSSE